MCPVWSRPLVNARRCLEAVAANRGTRVRTPSRPSAGTNTGRGGTPAPHFLRLMSGCDSLAVAVTSVTQLRPESRPELPVAAVLLRTARAALGLIARDVSNRGRM